MIGAIAAVILLLVAPRRRAAKWSSGSWSGGEAELTVVGAARGSPAGGRSPPPHRSFDSSSAIGGYDLARTSVGRAWYLPTTDLHNRGYGAHR